MSNVNLFTYNGYYTVSNVNLFTYIGYYTVSNVNLSMEVMYEFHMIFRDT